jgi:holo-[acyl-carrier protein] synthase
VILGIGIDTVDVPRFSSLVRDTHGAAESRFVQATFRADELRYCREQARGSLEEHLAARFAAKEAALKALDAACALLTLTPPAVPLLDVELLRDARGRPSLGWHGAARTLYDALEIARAHVSLSHDGPSASAVVILER